MRIRQLHLKNIGPFADEKIEFPPCPATDKAEIHIFTGQNGSGKTTLLKALASIFTNCYGNNQRNSHDTKAFINLGINNFIKQVWGRGFDSGFIFELQNKNHVRRMYKVGPPLIFRLETIDIEYGNLFDQEAFLYGAYGGLIFEFFVFAASGHRDIQSKPVEAISEPKNFNPFAQSLEFIKDYSATNQISINQLIANNISKRALAKEESDSQEAERYARVIREIESLVFDVTGEQIKFTLKRNPINLLVNLNDVELEFDVLPDGLRSLISWMADLLGRVDLLKWTDDVPITEKNLILFLDEIEVHLHPAWQRKVLPAVQKIFKNSQIFISTHSPFVVNSVDDAWVYKLELDATGRATVPQPIKSEDGYSYSHVLSEIFGIEEEFGVGVQADLAKFKELRNKILASRNGSPQTEQELLRVAKKLAQQSEELQTIVQFELRQINKRTGKNLVL